jgi:ferrous iron transport protein A
MGEAKGAIDEEDNEANRTTLTRMLPGQSGRIVKIDGGYGLVRRLDALGIRIGKKVTKVSAQWMKGPILVRQGNTQVALGFGMASKVLVQITRNKQ